MITTRDIDIFLTGVRADFYMVVDQAKKQLAAFESNVYLDATNKVGPLFEEVSATGQQRKEFAQVTGVSRLLPTEETQPFPETTYVPSYITSVEPFAFSRRIVMSRASVERRDSKYRASLEEGSKLQVAAAMTKAQNKFDVFNKGASLFTAKHLFNYGDGVALFGSTHPDKEGSTHSNITTAADITSTSIEANVLVLQNQVDDIGEPMPMGGGRKFMVITPQKVKKAKEEIGTEFQVGTANNTINVWYGGDWTLVSSPLLQATYGGSNTAWWVIDGMFSPLKEVIFKAVTNENWFDDNNKTYVHDISFEHRCGAIDYRGMVYNAGA